jgi:hypothetical protein
MGRGPGVAIVMALAVLTALAGETVAGEPVAGEPVAGAPPPLTPIEPEQSAAAFERIKGMQGTWSGVSTKGWEEQVTYREIAAGSCVLETSFDAHPDETMLTLYHMHRGDLLLTHYCVAKNQPRLRATAASSDGSTIEFTFLDATGIPSRDEGHMDRLVMTFGGDAVRKQWFWYSAGNESPMERITLTRAAAGGLEEDATASQAAQSPSTIRRTSP